MFPAGTTCSNALGVIALATELSIPFDKIAASLRRFRARAPPVRNQIRERRFLLVDDYAHHPTEIRATLRDRAIDRTQTASDDVSAASLFANQSAVPRIRRAFDDADRVVITDVYPASEAPIPGITVNDCR
jgi:UDP-N-acetylmuramate--alanine ligase